MLLNTVLSPVNGLFSNMPDTIWGPDFDPTMVDIELFTRIGTLDASPLVEHFTTNGVLDTAGLGNFLFQRYSKNWDRIWKVLVAEYDAFLTNTVDEARNSKRDTKANEIRDLRDTELTEAERLAKTSGSDVKTGSIARNRDNELTRALTETETRNTTDRTTDGGTETSTDTFNETNETDSTLTKSGAENRTGSDNEVRALAGSERGSANTGTDESHTGTVDKVGSGTQTGNGSTATDKGLYGVGGAGLTPQSRDVADETRNFADSKKETETRNLVDHIGVNETRNINTTDTGTVNHATTDNLSFAGRNDHTVGTDKHTGTVSNETEFGKTSEVKGTGTIGKVLSGTEGDTGTESETYNSVTNAQTGTESGNETVTKNGTSTGTVGNTGSDVYEETFHSEGSSPLRTFQALIQEEIEGRSGQAWNFTDIVIRDVQTMIASKIWRRTHGVV